MATRHPRFAELVERIGRAVDVEPIPGRTLQERRIAWLALASTKHPHVVSRLVAEPLPKRTSELVDHVQRLVAFPDDPRIASALADFVVAHHAATSSEITHLLRQAQHRLGRLGDVRQRPRLEAIAGRAPSVRSVLDALAEPAPLTDEAGALAEALAARYAVDADRTADRGAALLAAIHAAPDDDGPREVYADWLGERDDPRGEFIALQLRPPTAASTHRERALLAQHAAAWSAPLGRFLWEVGFERGFVAGGNLLREAVQHSDELFAEPAWALVRHLELALYDDAAVLALLARPECARLRSVGVLAIDVASRLVAAGRREALEELYLFNLRGHPPLPWGGAIATLGALPRLHTLGLRVTRSDEIRAWLERAPVLDRLARLVVYAPPVAGLPVPLDGDELAQLVAARSEVHELVLGPPARMDGNGWSFTLTREAARGAFTHAVARYQRPKPTLKPRAYTQALVESLRRLPRGVQSLAIAHALQPSPGLVEAALAERPGVRVVPIE